MKDNRRTFIAGLGAAGTGLVLGSFAPLLRAATAKPNAKSALIVVDVQNCFVTGGTLAVKGGEEVVPVINKLAGVFENVVVTQDWHTPGHVSFARRTRARSLSEHQARLRNQVLGPDHAQAAARRCTIPALRSPGHHPQGLSPGPASYSAVTGPREDVDRASRRPEGARHQRSMCAVCRPISASRGPH